jgi:hypothetical protein
LRRHVVDRAGRTELRIDILTGRRAASSERIDLHFKSEVHGDESSVIVAFAVDVGKAQKNSRIIILSPREPLQFKDVVIKWDLGVEKTEICARR